MAESAPASMPVASAAAEPAVLPDSESWSLEDCIARLRSDSSTPLELRSAGIRLVRLSKTSALCLPENAPDDWLGNLAVAALGGDRWALGIAQEDRRRLAMPVLLARNGTVSSPTDAAEEEAAMLFASDDADLFPHILITPLRVLIIAEEVTTAIAGLRLNGARFEYRRKDDRWPYVALVCDPRAATSTPATQSAPSSETVDAIEVAQYRWDPDELEFLGPAMDVLPCFEGRMFELNISESAALIPVGGKIPEAPPPAPPQQPGREAKPERPPD